MRKFLSMCLFMLLILNLVPAIAEEPNVLTTETYVFHFPDDMLIEVEKMEKKEVVFSGESEYVLRGCTMLYSREQLQEMNKIGRSMHELNFETLLQKIASDDYERIYRRLTIDEDPHMLYGENLMMAWMMERGTSTVIVSHFYEKAGFMLMLSGSNPDETIERVAEMVMYVRALAKEAELNEAILMGEPDQIVVITADTARVRKEPNISGQLLKTAVKGETFTYVGEENDFYVIEIDGTNGYVHMGVSSMKTE